jgi:hypothetical protein
MPFDVCRRCRSREFAIKREAITSAADAMESSRDAGDSVEPLCTLSNAIL